MADLVKELIELNVQLRPYLMFHPKLSFEEKKATILQFIALKFLKENRNVTMSQFAKKLTLSLPSATQLIERLSNAKLVTRCDDNKDRRLIRLDITDKGQAEVDKFQKAREKRMRQIYSHISFQDIKNLVKIYKKLLTSLKKETL